MRGAGMLLVLADATQQSNCGPTPQEIGQTVVMVQPAVFFLGLLPLGLLLWLWRFKALPLGRHWKPLAATFVIIVSHASFVLATTHADKELLLIAMGVYGTSYATVLLLSARLFIATAPDKAGILANLPPLLVFGVPAALLALKVGTESWMGKHAEHIFTYPGYGGWVPGALFLVLILEVLIRRRRARRLVG